MSKKSMNNILVHGENVSVVYEGTLGKILRNINSLNFAYAPILVGTLVFFGVISMLMGLNYILHFLISFTIVFFFWFVKKAYVPNKGFLTVIGITKNPPSNKNKYFLHVGDATRAINEIPIPAIVKSKTPEKLEYPILIDFDMALRHMFAVGTTGSGKTTFSIYLLKQHLGIGGGAIIVDGKGDKDIYTDIVNTCIHFNREDDIFVINFNAPKESNKMNPLLVGDVDDISDLIGNLLESEGDNKIWAGRALSMMNGLMSCLVPLRDNNELYDPIVLRNKFDAEHGQGTYTRPREADPYGPMDGTGFYQPILTFKVVSKFLELGALRDLYYRMSDRNKAISEGKLSQYGLTASDTVELDRLLTYLASCDTSVRDSERNADISEGGSKMHSNSNVMWGEALDLFQGTYGDIFNTDTPNLTVQDIVYNSRFMYVLLPATKKNSRTLSMLGKIILALIKQAVASLLGDKISGNIEERRASSAIRPVVPFLAIMDEYGAYAVQGFDNVLAQARSLRVSVIIEVQEIASLEKGGDIDKKRLLGNTAIKVILKVEDLATAKELAEMIGTEQRAYVRHSSEGDSKKTFDVQERNIIEARTLSQMEGGHGYVRFSGETTAMLAGYYKPPNARYIQEFNSFDDLTVQRYRVLNTLDDLSKQDGVLTTHNPFDKDSELNRSLNSVEYSISQKTAMSMVRNQRRLAQIRSAISDLKYGPEEQVEFLKNATEDVKGAVQALIASAGYEKVA